MKKIYFMLLLVVMSMLFSSFVLAGLGCDTTPSSGSTAGNVIGKILDAGSLKFLGVPCTADNQLIGFIRICLAILIFAILYGVLSNVLPANMRAAAIVVSIVIALISAIFLPASLLTLFGETYATIFALIIIGGPIIGILMLLFMTPTPTRPWALLKFLVVCFLIWLISEIGQWGSLLAQAKGGI